MGRTLKALCLPLRACHYFPNFVYLIRHPLSADSGRPLRPIDLHDFLVPRAHTVKYCAYASVSPLERSSL